jgi:hypothetical protein
MFRARVLALVLLLLPGCAFTSRADNLNGLAGPDGRPFQHLSTHAIAINFLWVLPLFGNATLDETVDAFTAEARKLGATRVRIVNSDTSIYWYVLPPISFLFQPVATTVVGDAEFEPASTGASETPSDTAQPPTGEGHQAPEEPAPSDAPGAEHAVPGA